MNEEAKQASESGAILNQALKTLSEVYKPYMIRKIESYYERADKPVPFGLEEMDFHQLLMEEMLAETVWIENFVERINRRASPS